MLTQRPSWKMRLVQAHIRIIPASPALAADGAGRRLALRARARMDSTPALAASARACCQASVAGGIERALTPSRNRSHPGGGDCGWEPWRGF